MSGDCGPEFDLPSLILNSLGFRGWGGLAISSLSGAFICGVELASADTELLGVLSAGCAVLASPWQ